jgi:hypothetical protein
LGYFGKKTLVTLLPNQKLQFFLQMLIQSGADVNAQVFFHFFPVTKMFDG